MLNSPLWQNKQELKNGKNTLTLWGDSISMMQSGFYIPSHKFMLDAGINCDFTPDHIFITHTHSDHAQQLAAILTGAQSCPKVYAPLGTIRFLQEFLLAKQKMSACDDNLTLDDIKHKCQFVSCDAGVSFELNIKKNVIRVDILKTEHRVPSVGYAFSIKNTKLREEFVGLSGKEIAEKRKSGVEVSQVYFKPWFMYIGDSTHRWIEFNKEVMDRRFPFIICECTFIGDLNKDHDAKQAADQYTHTCWEDLKPLIDKHNTDDDGNPKKLRSLFVLTHWSNRYKISDIDKVFENEPDVWPWLPMI